MRRDTEVSDTLARERLRYVAPVSSGWVPSPADLAPPHSVTSHPTPPLPTPPLPTPPLPTPPLPTPPLPTPPDWSPPIGTHSWPPPPTGANGLDRLAGLLPMWARTWLRPAGERQVAWLLAAVVLLVALSGWLALRHAPASTDPATATAPQASPSGPPSMPGIVVDVGGRVRRPGLVTLTPGARVADALRAAGGALRPADIVTLDLAARVADGQLLLIGIPAAAAGPPGSPTNPLSLAAATVEQLDTLPGVGPVLARHIVEWRDGHGGFTSLDQLRQVSGIGPRTYERLKALVTL